jgi:outer membrane receptor protein involved in Fe transport
VSKNVKVRKIIILFISIVLGIAVHAQKGKITGKVTNNKNQPLAGVIIKIGSLGNTQTNIEGRFNIQIAAGTKIELSFSYVGYKSKVVEDIIVKNNEEEELNVVLDESTKKLDDVVVKSTSRKEGTSAIISFQKNNTSLSSGIAADFIKKTPDRNMGEVLKRVSGTTIQDNKYVIVRGLSDRYNQAMLNNAQMPSSEPDRKVFAFDVIPSALVDNVIINKTATPDLTGEFAGGLVQIQTKDVPTKPMLSVGFSLGVNTVSTGKDFVSNARNSQDWLGFDNGTRSIPAGIPENRQQFSKLSDNQKAELSKLFPSNVYQTVTKGAAPIQTFNFMWGNSFNLKNGAKIGVIASLQYRKAELVYFDVERNRFDFDRSNTNTNYIFRYNETQNVYNTNVGGLLNLTYIKGKHKISWKNIYNRNFEDRYVERTGSNLNNNALVDFKSSFLNQRGLFASQLEGIHQINRKSWKFNWNINASTNNKSQPDYRVVEFRRNISTPSATPILNDDETRRFFSNLNDYSIGGNFFVSIPFKIKDKSQLLKIGGSNLTRFRNFTSRNFQYTGNQSVFSLPIEQIFANSNIGGDKIFLNEITQNTDKYFGLSVLNGGYFMFDNKVTEKLRLVWGLRTEYFNQFLRTRDLSNERVVINTEKWDVLPSANLTYSFNPRNQLRLASSITVARPEFREIAPFAFFDYDAIYGISGNPNLERTSIINLDARYEFYPAAGELLSFGAFYKNFKNPIEFIMNPGSNADRQNYEYRNANNANTFGIEIEGRKKLNNLFTVFGNFTYLYSKVSFNNLSAGGQQETSNRPLQGQAPYLVNGGIQYFNPKNELGANILYNRVGPKLYVVGSPPPGAGFYDIYENPRDLVDIQISKRIFQKHAEVKLTISDVLNQPIAHFDNLTVRKNFKESDGDRITDRFRPGTTITFSFVYDLFKQ